VLYYYCFSFYEKFEKDPQAVTVFTPVTVKQKCIFQINIAALNKQKYYPDYSGNTADVLPENTPADHRHIRCLILRAVDTGDKTKD
jgi:hypothetical protein